MWTPAEYYKPEITCGPALLPNDHQNHIRCEHGPYQAARVRARTRLLALETYILSPDVHRTVLNYLNTQDEQMFSEEVGGYSLDRFYIFYELFCTTRSEGPGQRNGPTAFFPPHFQAILDECLLFYLHSFQPYFEHRLERKELGPNMEGDDPRLGFIKILERLAFDNAPYENRSPYCTDEARPSLAFTIQARWKAGLLRGGQVLVIETLLRKLLLELTALLGERTDSIETVRLVEMERAIDRADRAIKHFFGNARFRSERLEVLLVKYLGEPEVNTDVVRGIEIAQRKYEDIYHAKNYSRFGNLLGLASF
ncbi:hypothetical protein BJ508DRAFT_411220, partial [Ascobolus immersus RN42]